MRHYTVSEAARATGYAEITLRKKIWAGEIKAEKTRNRITIAESEIAHLIRTDTPLDDLVQRLVDKAPTLTDDQVAALRVVLAAGR